jgi:hypothetical protein
MLTVTVIYPPNYPEDAAEPEQRWTWNAPGPSVADALAQTHRACPQLVAGDLIEVVVGETSDGEILQVHVVELDGYTLVDRDEADRWRQLNCYLRLLGVAAARRYGMI